MSEAAAEFRLDRLEADVRDIKTDLHDMKATLARIDLTVARIDERLNATLPHLATKAELADKPGKTFIVGGIALLTAVYALGLAGLAAALTALPALRALVHG